MKFRNPDQATRAIIEAANTKLKHAANLARGKSAFWYLMGGGVGGGALLAGAGILCGGYSYITGNKVIARQVAESVKGVLDTTTIHGTVSGEVGMKDGIVRIDPNTALLRVVGQAAEAAPRLTPERAALPALKAGVFTNFTVFKIAKFGAGEVHTAWEYKDGDQERPSSQFCEYTQFTVGTNQNSVELGRDGRMDLAKTAPAGLDLRAAYANCQWWNDSAPVMPAAPVQTILVHAAKR